MEAHTATFAAVVTPPGLVSLLPTLSFLRPFLIYPWLKNTGEAGGVLHRLHIPTAGSYEVLLLMPAPGHAKPILRCCVRAWSSPSTMQLLRPVIPCPRHCYEDSVCLAADQHSFNNWDAKLPRRQFSYLLRSCEAPPAHQHGHCCCMRTFGPRLGSSPVTGCCMITPCSKGTNVHTSTAFMLSSSCLSNIESNLVMLQSCRSSSIIDGVVRLRSVLQAINYLGHHASKGTTINWFCSTA